MLSSKLLDFNDIALHGFGQLFQEIQKTFIEKQPRWARSLIQKNQCIRQWIGLTGASRQWEYPWAIKIAELGKKQRILDVGGGGSPFAYYLASIGHEVYVADPFLNQGKNPIFNQNKGYFRNIRSLIFRIFLNITGIRAVWGIKPSYLVKDGIQFYSYSAAELKFADKQFDCVFCLSVMEHIPEELWGRCMNEFDRVLKPGGRLVITLDMSTKQADDEQYKKLISASAIKLLGEPTYAVPISMEDKSKRHPGITYETIGLLWQK